MGCRMAPNIAPTVAVLAARMTIVVKSALRENPMAMAPGMDITATSSPRNAPARVPTNRFLIKDMNHEGALVRDGPAAPKTLHGFRLRSAYRRSWMGGCTRSAEVWGGFFSNRGCLVNSK